VIDEMVSTNWYAGGLCFECRVCGRCCSGPGEGYIWVARPEIELIAQHLHITPGEARRKYLRRVGLRTTIIEDELTRDCIFLQTIDGVKRCGVYAVRPAQCRSWPFWPENLLSPDDWNRAAFRCPGVNFGRHYSVEEIERIRKNRRWWGNPKDAADSSQQ
jgi:Fe-S-cluster containining protein